MLVDPSTSGPASFSYGEPPVTMGATCDGMHILLNNWFDSRIELNLFDSSATIKFHIFNG
jgi:hypothetical protein